MINKTHLLIQKAIVEAVPEAVLEKRFKEIGRIADVVWEEKKVVFEVQFSPIHPLEARERTRDYALMGYHVIWILHENMFSPLRPTPFQDFLQHFPPLYTNIDEVLGGDIYQIRLKKGKVEKIPVALNKFDFKTTFHLRWPFMKKIYYFCALSLLTTPLSLFSVCNGSNTWFGISEVWIEAPNWTNTSCYPNGPLDTAIFGPTANGTIAFLDTSTITLLNLTFNSNALNYTIGFSPDELIFAGTAPSVNVLGGTQVITTLIQLQSPTTFTIDSTLNFSGTSLTSQTTQPLTMTGTGTLNNSSSNFSPSSILQQGSLTFNNEAGATVDSPLIQIEGGTVTNFGSYSYLSLSLTNTTFSSTSGSVGSSGASTTFNSNNTFNLFDSTFSQNGFVTINGNNNLLTVDSASVVGPTRFEISGQNNTFIINGSLDVPEGLYLPVTNMIIGTGKFINTIPSISGDSINNFGTVIPGSLTTVGTLNMQAFEYLQQPSGTLVINVTNGSASQLQTLYASLNGTLEVVALPGLNTPGTYTILTASSVSPIQNVGILGEFASVEFLNFPSNFVTGIFYDPSSVILEIAPALMNYFGNYYYMVFSSLNQVNYFLFKHFDWIKEKFFCDMDYCGRLKCCNNTYTLNAYAGPIGSIGTIGSKGKQLGLNYDREGFIIGAEYIMTCAALGFEFDYERMNGSVKKRFGKINNDHCHFNAYGFYSPVSEMTVSGIIGGGSDRFSTKRFTIPNTSILGKTGAQHFDALVGVQYTISRGLVPFLVKRLLITPMASLQFMSLTVDGFSEHHSSVFQAHFEKQKYQSVRSLLGFTTSWNGYWKQFLLKPQINFSWQREFYDDARDLHFKVGNSMINQTIQILPATRDVFLAGVDLNVLANDRFGLQAGYQFEGNCDCTNHFFTLTFDAAF